MPRRFKPLDAIGKRIKLGAIVRIVDVPDLTSMSHQQRAKSEPVFQHLLGTRKRVRGFDRHGFVELDFRIRKGRLCGWHSVALEPYLLRVSNHRRVV